VSAARPLRVAVYADNWYRPTPDGVYADRSLVVFIAGVAAAAERTILLGQLDPDLPRFGSGNPPSYEAVRTGSELYVEYETGEAEYYDLRRDPFEIDNRIDLVPERRIVQLHRILRRLVTCHRQRACWAAARPK
jgi:hypothetical protein